MEPTDQILLHRWRKHRDGEAFQLLVQRHAGMVYATCSRILGNATEAEDVAQESFLTLATTRTRPGEYLGPWLHRVATNRALDTLRSAKRRHQREQSWQETRPKAAEMGWNDVAPLVDEAIAALPPKTRHMVVAHFLEGQTHQAIAARAGVTRAAVSHRISTGVARIRKRLRAKGVLVPATMLTGWLGANGAGAAPAAFAAKLGKMALAGTLPSAAAGGLAGAGGLLGAKAVALGAAMLVLAFAGGWLYWQGPAWRETGVAGAASPQSREATPNPPRETPMRQTTAAPPPDAPAAGEASPVLAEEEAEIPFHVFDGFEGATLDIEIRDQGGALAGEGRIDITLRTAQGTHGIGSGYQHGRFQLRQVPPGERVIAYAVTGDGNETTELGSLIMPEEATTLGLRLGAAATVSGRVVDVRRRPLPQVRVVALSRPGDARITSVLSDSSGRFRVDTLPRGEQSLGVNLSRAGALRKAITLGAGQHLGGVSLEFSKPLAPIAGIVQTRDGEPLRNGSLVFEENPRSVYHARLDEGLFAVTVTDSGLYNVTLNSSGHELTQDAQAAPGNTGLVLVAHPKAKISGHVFDAVSRESIPGAQVSLICDGHDAQGKPQRQQSGVTCGEDGKFVTSLSMAGDLRITAHAAGYASASAFLPGYEPGQEHKGISIGLHAGKPLRGWVTDASGNPVAEACVGIYLGHPSGMSLKHCGGDASALHAKTQANGAFELWGMLEDAQTLAAFKEGYLPALQPLPEPGMRTKAVTLVLDAGGTIAGQVLQQGEPVQGAHVALDPEYVRGEPMTMNSLHFRAETDKAGRFHFSGIPLRPGSVSVSHQSSSRCIPYDFGDETTQILEIELSSGNGEIVGHVTAPWETLPPGGAHVSVSSGTNAPVDMNKNVRLEEDGHYAVSGLAPGNYRVRFSIGRNRHITREVRLGPGGRERVDAVFPPANAELELVYVCEEPRLPHHIQVRIQTAQGEESFDFHGNEEWREGIRILRSLPAGPAHVQLDGAPRPHMVELMDGARSTLYLGGDAAIAPIIEGLAPGQEAGLLLVPEESATLLLGEDPITITSDGEFRRLGLAFRGEYNPTHPEVIRCLPPGNYVLLALLLPSGLVSPEAIDQLRYLRADVRARDGETTEAWLDIAQGKPLNTNLQRIMGIQPRSEP